MSAVAVKALTWQKEEDTLGREVTALDDDQWDLHETKA